MSLSLSNRDRSSSPESLITSARNYRLKSYNKPIFLAPSPIGNNSIPTSLQEPKTITLSLNGSLIERISSPEEAMSIQSTKTSVTEIELKLSSINHRRV
jgi:hypothetical protein